MFRDDVRSAMVVMLLMLAVLVLMSSIGGCGPPTDSIRIQYVGVANQCIDDAKALAEQCPHGPECLAKLHDLETRCDEELDAVCSQSRRARRLCNAAH